MMIKILKNISVFKTEKHIKNILGETHFKRFSIFAYKGIGLYLHYFTKSDEEKHEHDHPWDFWSIVLYGGYIELHKGEMYFRNVFSFKKFKAEHPHRIFKLIQKYCITLVFLGKRRRDWGYPLETGWIDHKEYRRKKIKGLV